MSTLSDVQALYGSVRGTWAKSQAHFFAHVVLVLVVFGICGATLPGVAIPRLNAAQVTGNEWFKLAKDTGLLYVAFVIPVIVLAAYAAVLRASGQLLVSIAMMIFPPSPRAHRLELLSVPLLEPLALTLKRKDFALSDLLARSTEFVLKYQAKKSEAWETYQNSIADLTKNAQVYLGDFLVFLLAWILLFRVAPHAAWTQVNQSLYWPVIILLLGLAWFAGFRVSRAVAAMLSLLLLFVAATLRADPDVAPLLEVADDDRNAVRQRLEELLRTERERVDRRPSLRRFLGHHLGVSRETKRGPEWRQDRGFPFRSLYERGQRFSWDPDEYEAYDSEWLENYFAYLYYRLHRRLSTLVQALWYLIRHLVTGAP